MGTEFKRMLARGKTEAEVVSSSDVPRAREIVVAYDTGAFWIGDGTRSASDLPKQGPVAVNPANGLVVLPTGDMAPTIDSSTQQLPDIVRTRIAANLADPATPEGKALVGVGGVSDQAVAGFIGSAAGSATKKALGGSFVADKILAGDGIDPTGATDSAVAIKQLLDAFPGKTFYVPPGDYRIDTTLVISESNGLALSQNARIFAGAAMDVLISYAPALPSGQYAEDKGIVGGVLDGANLAGTLLSIATVLHFTLTRTTFKNGIRRGLVTVAGKGAEIMAYDLRFVQTGTSNVADNVAIDSQMGDCHFDNIIIRDWVVGVRDKNGARISKVHVWLSGNGIVSRYPGSIGFDLTDASNVESSYADTYQTAFKINAAAGRPRLRNVRAIWNASVLSGVTAPSWVFDNTAGVGVFCYGVDLGGRADVPTEFINGSSAKMNVLDPVSGGYINNVQQYRSGVAFGTTNFTPNLFGSTVAGTQSYGSRSGYMDVGDGVVTYRFTMTVTLGSNTAGNLRIGGLPMVPGAASVNVGQGPVNTAAGVTAMRSVIGANGNATPLVAIPQDIAGVEIPVSGLAGQTVTIRGSIICPFSYA